MISARIGWLWAEVIAGAEDTNLLIDAMCEADILRIDLEDIERVHVARVPTEEDLIHFALALDRDNISETGQDGDDHYAVIREEADLWFARAELERTSLGRGEMLELRRHYLLIADQTTAAALGGAIAARAGRFMHGPSLTIQANPPAKV